MYSSRIPDGSAQDNQLVNVIICHCKIQLARELDSEASPWWIRNVPLALLRRLSRADKKKRIDVRRAKLAPSISFEEDDKGIQHSRIASCRD